MKHTTKRLLSMVLALVMLVSLLAATGLSAFAAKTTFSSEEEIDEEKIIFTIPAEKFRFPYNEMCSDGVYEDADSTLGQAAVISYADRSATGDNGLIKALTPANTLAFYCFGQTIKENNPIGEPTISELKAVAQQDGYAVLLFQDVELFPEPGDYYAYIFDCWGLQIPFSADQVNSCVGELVDVYLSMKITGSISDPVNDPLVYYIDKIVVCEPTAGDQVHECTYGDWITDADTHTRTCTGCGMSEKAAHKWDNGVVSKEASETADGEKLYTCTVCQATKTEKIDRIDSTVEPAPAPGPVSGQPNPGLIIAIVMIVLAVGIVVAAVILLKPKKK